MDGTENDYAEEMYDRAEFALDIGCLEGAALGIAKQLVDRGWHSLTERQQGVFESVVIPATTRECQRCGAEIIASELGAGGDHCGWCAHQIAKGN